MRRVRRVSKYVFYTFDIRVRTYLGSATNKMMIAGKYIFAAKSLEKSCEKIADVTERRDRMKNYDRSLLERNVDTTPAWLI